jgi:glycosyltransferase involved in cell wall biosynthesis
VLLSQLLALRGPPESRQGSCIAGDKVIHPGSRKIEVEMETLRQVGHVVVGCPDARPPAYQAVIGLNRAGLLGRFVTASYYRRQGWLANVMRRTAPRRLAHLERLLLRRHHPEIPPESVCAHPSFDLVLRLESRLAAGSPSLRRRIARWRTERFDRALASAVERASPCALLVFSDVGSRVTLPLCRRLGIPTILSMVHGDVREEQRVLAEEADAAPEFLPIYLGNGRLDRDELDWLHERRLHEVALADRVAVPSDHIAQQLVRYGTPREHLRVIPYAADCHRFQPKAEKRHESTCTFLFAGGISQRKGIKYLLEAWRAIRRPGWRLQLLGPLPHEIGPVRPYLEMIEPLGRVGHAEMPSRLADADVFVFPSLFEGSAVVTYEALACGLPSVVTENAGSVVRDGVEGFVVRARDPVSLAARMEQLGKDPGLRETMASAARARAHEFDWPRYHSALVRLVEDVAGPAGAAGRPSLRTRARTAATRASAC